jgi:hypothetical protein
MKNTTHTPGPWIVRESSTVIETANTHPQSKYPDGKAKIAEVLPLSQTITGWGPAVPVWDAETDANARLIAAAPELLESLKDLENILSCKPCSCDEQRLLMLARAAITKGA